MVLDKVRVIEPYGDSDVLLNRAPSIQLLPNTKYKVTVATYEPVFVLVSRKSSVPTFNTWVRLGEPYACPEVSEFVVDSADLHASTQILLTLWGPVNDPKKGDSTSAPVTFKGIKETRNGNRVGPPYVLTYSYRSEIITITLSRAR